MSALAGVPVTDADAEVPSLSIITGLIEGPLAALEQAENRLSA